MKTGLKAINNRMNHAEGWISDLKDIIVEITQSEEQTGNQI